MRSSSCASDSRHTSSAESQFIDQAVVFFHMRCLTSNVTTFTEVWSVSFGLVLHVHYLPLRGTPWWVLLCIQSLGIIPEAIFVPNFVSFASSWRKITHSVTHPAYLMCQEPKLSLRNGFLLIYHRVIQLKIFGHHLHNKLHWNSKYELPILCNFLAITGRKITLSPTRHAPRLSVMNGIPDE